MANFRANIGRHRAENEQASANPNFVQGELDQLETPDEVVDALIETSRSTLGHCLQNWAWEPACGTGRVARRLGKYFDHVEATDIQTGRDFLAIEDKPENHWSGSIITNPPYSRGRCDAFIRQALRLADGGVAMLVRGGSLWGERRASGLWVDFPKPCAVVIIPWRIFFIDARGVPITGQAYDHCWLVWRWRPSRGTEKTILAVADPKGAQAQRDWIAEYKRAHPEWGKDK